MCCSAYELLDREILLAYLKPAARDVLSQLDVFASIDSTNQYLWEQNAPKGAVCLAEYQSAGRGQQGRRWVSPYASGLCLSLSWRYETMPQALSLALGVVVVRVLEAFGATHIGLKWPNDVVWQGKKLAGLLVESRFVGGQWSLVIGLGLNIYPVEFELDLEENSLMAQMPTDLTEILLETPSRNRLAAALLSEFLDMLANYAHQGFAVYHAAWQHLDVLANQTVTVFNGSHASIGTARGVDAHGALLLETAQGLRSFSSARVRS